jgi:hypothetical protein
MSSKDVNVALQRLKMATANALKQARACGDPNAIEEAQLNDDFVGKLISKNGHVTVAEAAQLATLSYRVCQLLEWIQEHFPDLGKWLP